MSFPVCTAQTNMIIKELLSANMIYDNFVVNPRVDIPV